MRPRPNLRTLVVIQSLGLAFVAISVLVLFVFARIRWGATVADPRPTDAYGVRYVEHPSSAILHIAPGLAFVFLAPLQFIGPIRRRHPRFHRVLGRALVICALTSTLFALIINFLYPAFGGWTTQSATVVFGAFFLFAVLKGVRHIRRKEVGLHREWMIRTFAAGLGVASIRLWILILTVSTGMDFEAAFGPSFWLGFGTNLASAEVWIRMTRVRPEGARKTRG